jgi:hypothetical protein
MTEQEYKTAHPSLKIKYQQWLGNELYLQTNQFHDLLDMTYSELMNKWYINGQRIFFSKDYSYIVYVSVLRIYKNWHLSSCYGQMTLSLIDNASKTININLDKNVYTQGEIELVKKCCESRPNDSKAMQIVRKILKEVRI